MTNIVFLITGLNTGGAEMQVYHMVESLKQSGKYRPVVVSMIPPGPVGERLKEIGIPVRTLNMVKGNASVSAFFKLLSILKEEKAEILHTHMFHATLLGRLAKLFKLNLRVISTLHSINIGGSKREKVLALTDSLSHRTTVISEIAWQKLLESGAVSKKRSLMVPNGMDITKFQPNGSLREQKRKELGIRGNEFCWLAVGRFEEVKNYPNMLQAFSKLREEKPEARLFLVGTGHLEEEVKQLVTQLGLKEQVSFLGLRRDVHEIMNAVEAYVLSSDWEGMPLVLLEAAASSLPIVATNVGGNKEVVIENETGFLVKPMGAKELSQKMLHLMKLSEEQRKIMGAKGREVVRNKYDLSKIMMEWDHLYQNA